MTRLLQSFLDKNAELGWRRFPLIGLIAFAAMVFHALSIRFFPSTKPFYDDIILQASNNKCVVVIYLIVILFTLLPSRLFFMAGQILVPPKNHSNLVDKELLINYEFLSMYSVPPKIQNGLIPLITTNRVLFFKYWFSIDNLPILSKSKRFWFGSKCLLIKLRKEDQTPFINSSLVSRLRRRAPYYKEFLLEEICDIWVHPKKQKASLLLSSGDKYTFGLTYAPQDYHEELWFLLLGWLGIARLHYFLPKPLENWVQIRTISPDIIKAPLPRSIMTAAVYQKGQSNVKISIEVSRIRASMTMTKMTHDPTNVDPETGERHKIGGERSIVDYHIGNQSGTIKMSTFGVLVVVEGTGVTRQELFDYASQLSLDKVVNIIRALP